MYLGLDPSLTDFGYALLDMDQPPEHRLITSGRWKTSANWLEPVRYATQQARLLNFLLANKSKIDFVATEAPPFKMSYSEGLYALYTRVLESLFRARIPFAVLAPTSVKSLASVYLPPNHIGKIEKAEMVYVASQLCPGAPKKLNHNIADAICIAHSAYRFSSFVNGTLLLSDMTEKERASFYQVAKKDKTVSGLYPQEGTRWFNLTLPKYDEFYDLKGELILGPTVT